jgi:predicted small secreted protein
MAARPPVAGRSRLIGGLVLVALALTACAAGPNTAAGTGADVGFWLGLWHGVITPVTFVISLFTDDVTIYEVANDGNWYDFGYVLGLMVAFGGAAGSRSVAGRGGAASASRKRR